MKINCDLGERDEHWSHDQRLIPLVDQVNVSCGAHAGSTNLIFKTLQKAKELNKSIGIHPSYPDKKNFGRVSVDMSQQALIDSLKQQLDYFLNLCNRLGISPTYVKPHGALYHDCQKESIFEALLQSMESLRLELPVLLITKPKIVRSDLVVWQEGFLDRRYDSSSTLRSRQNKGVIDSIEEAFEQYVCITERSQIPIASGGFADVQVDTVCVHSDSPIALKLLEKINEYRSFRIYKS